MYHDSISDSLIPHKYIPLVYDDKEIVLKKFEKLILKQQFLSKLKIIFNEFISFDDNKIHHDFKVLENNECLKITPYDLECVNYNIQPLNMAEIFSLLDNLYFEEIYRKFLIVNDNLLLAKDMFKEKNYEYIKKKVEVLNEFDSEFKKICYGKNLADLYDNRVGFCKSNLKYLRKYISALI